MLLCWCHLILLFLMQIGNDINYCDFCSAALMDPATNIDIARSPPSLSLVNLVSLPPHTKVVSLASFAIQIHLLG